MIETTYLISAVLLTAGLQVYMFRQCLGRRVVSAVFWLAILAWYTVPSFGDAWSGRIEVSNPYFVYADTGLPMAIAYSTVHTVLAAIFYRAFCPRAIARRSVRQDEKLRKWPLPTVIVFTVAYLAALTAVIVQNSDLSRDYTFFTHGDVTAYEQYAFVAFMPLLGVLVGRYGLSSRWTWLAALSAVLGAYLIGIRFYTLMSVGYLAVCVVFAKVASANKRVLALTVILIFAVPAFLFWQLARSLGARGHVSEVATYATAADQSQLSTLVSEASVRLSFYDLVGRMEGGHRGPVALVDAAESWMYPLVVRTFGGRFPLGVSHRVYELESRYIGTGVSMTPSLYGADWFDWGWLGAIVGPIQLAALLVLCDWLWCSKHPLAVLVGPSLIFVCAYIARTGIYDTLWVPLRALPLTACLYGIAWLLEKGRSPRPSLSRTVMVSEHRSLQRGAGHGTDGETCGY